MASVGVYTPGLHERSLRHNSTYRKLNNYTTGALIIGKKVSRLHSGLTEAYKYFIFRSVDVQYSMDSKFNNTIRALNYAITYWFHSADHRPRGGKSA